MSQFQMDTSTGGNVEVFEVFETVVILLKCVYVQLCYRLQSLLEHLPICGNIPPFLCRVLKRWSQKPVQITSLRQCLKHALELELQSTAQVTCTQKKDHEPERAIRCPAGIFRY